MTPFTKRLFWAANSGLAISWLCFVLATLISYPYAEQFSMSQQLTGHISMILFATSLKISYVLRTCSIVLIWQGSPLNNKPGLPTPP